jgi:hypothetical protein
MKDKSAPGLVCFLLIYGIIALNTYITDRTGKAVPWLTQMIPTKLAGKRS